MNIQAKTKKGEIAKNLEDTSVEEKKINCAFCGAKFKVIYVILKDNNSDRIIYCPECEEEYFIRALKPISENSIYLLSPRTDGRRGSLQSER